MSNVLFALAGFLCFAAGAWGLILIIPIIYHWGGFIVVIVALIFTPATLLIVPWFNAIAHGDWFLVILNYGTPIVCGVLLLLANQLEKSQR
jgi:hypothetical protein